MQLVSIIMPAFNAAATISASVESVLAQTYRNWELIIINDGSSDNTVGLATKYAQADNRIVVVDLKKNGGLPNARNQGINKATGDFVAFLDSDDTWAPEKLNKQVNFHLKQPTIKISHTGFDLFNAGGVVKRPLKRIVEFNYKKSGNLIPSIYCKNSVGVLTVMADKELIQKVGGFDINLWTMEDQDLWIRIAKLGEEFGYINEDLASYRLGSGGITNKINKYKNAYRKLIAKYKVETIETKSYRLALANYYRYFGIVYLKEGAYKLSLLYLVKSIKFDRYLLDRFLTSILLSKALLKSVFKR
ncbi:glycosyltransferase [Mucilaginibacter sp. UR6-11]|uniref:glycosyltransferase family 2 protein n=1 Tax=Mucilaginibacter sp. UR6-11 TaxID=1435644 RepID=UPI001E306F8B|nr:glycosyltransferase [Mucilaginibacter sp. UR6-11]MCC8423980.1 glycosyltransferase [Mucilaginibacter sp. UR6-11]